MAGLGLLIGLWLPATATANPRNFNLAAGPAETGLNEFAVQSGLQVLFQTELAQGRQVNAVRGQYTLKEALSRLLADTGLAAQYDEKAGIVAISREESKRPVVHLPPYTVEGDPTSWRYSRMGNIEVLSSCIDDVTHRVMQQVFRLQEALEQVLPPDLIFQSDAPVLYVLHSDRDRAAVPQELLNKLQLYEGEKNSSTASMTWNIGIMRSYVFWDMDSRAIYFILNEGGFMLGRLSIRADYLRQLMSHRTPALPGWFIEGMVELYPTVTLDPYGFESFSIGRPNQHRLPGGVAKFAPFVWISDMETHAVKKGTKPELMPLLEMIAGPAPAPTSPAYDRWKAQSALFVRWALHSAKNGREALWKLLRTGDQKALTETDFQTCFNMTTEQAGEAMRRYLPKAIRHEFKLKPSRFADLPDYILRSATEMDISLVKGDLDRLKIDYVRRFFPRLTARYIEQARFTLRSGYGLTDPNPRLIGLMGLCECDAGNDLAAHPLLEQAVAGGPNRPRVYYELARIRFRMALAQVKNGQLSAEQADNVLKVLATGRQHAPPLLASYELMSDVFAQMTPTAAQLEILAGGLAYFPRHAGLIKAVANAYTRQGMIDEGRRVLSRGLEMVDNAGRAELLSLQRQLAPDLPSRTGETTSAAETD